MRPSWYPVVAKAALVELTWWNSCGTTSGVSTSDRSSTEHTMQVMHTPARSMITCMVNEVEVAVGVGVGVGLGLGLGGEVEVEVEVEVVAEVRVEVEVEVGVEAEAKAEADLYGRARVRRVEAQPM